MRIGWRKSIESIVTVTTLRCAWRMQASAPASSTSFIIQPPWTLPSRLACSGCINWERVVREALMGLGARRSGIPIDPVRSLPCLLIYIFPELAAIECVQTLRFLHQDVYQAVGQVTH